MSKWLGILQRQQQRWWQYLGQTKWEMHMISVDKELMESEVVVVIEVGKTAVEVAEALGYGLS